jgi:hypothetical protein
MINPLWSEVCFLSAAQHATIDARARHVSGTAMWSIGKCGKLWMPNASGAVAQ